MATIFGETKIFVNPDGYSAEIPRESSIVSKLLYLAQFWRYNHFCVLQFLQKKFENSKWLPFLARQNVLEIQMATLQRYPAIRIFCRNRSI